MILAQVFFDRVDGELVLRAIVIEVALKTTWQIPYLAAWRNSMRSLNLIVQQQKSWRVCLRTELSSTATGTSFPDTAEASHANGVRSCSHATVQVRSRFCCKRSKAGVLSFANRRAFRKHGVRMEAGRLVEARIPTLPKAIFATDMPFSRLSNWNNLRSHAMGYVFSF